MAISVPDTAFVIACYRANHEEASCDPFAKLWVKPGLQNWVDDFAEKVSEYDEILHCMRNRYFYQTLTKLIEEERNLLCLNLGAGFSMYPYNLPENIVTIEADFNNVTDYKKEAVSTFEAQGLLPKRDVTFIGTDITSETDRARLKKRMNEYPKHRKVILIEGVLFFLDHSQIADVVRFCREILATGDMLLAVSFDDKTAHTAVFRRLKNYFDIELHSDGIATTLPHSFYENLEGFELKSRDSSLRLAQDLELVPRDISEQEVLNEHCYFLIRK